MGFGATQEGNQFMSDTLQMVEVNVVSHQVCNAQYDNKIQNLTMFCARDQGKDSCQGDSGGPIVDLTTNTQMGVVSWVRISNLCYCLFSTSMSMLGSFRIIVLTYSFLCILIILAGRRLCP